MCCPARSFTGPGFSQSFRRPFWRFASSMLGAAPLGVTRSNSSNAGRRRHALYRPSLASELTPSSHGFKSSDRHPYLRRRATGRAKCPQPVLHTSGRTGVERSPDNDLGDRVDDQAPQHFRSTRMRSPDHPATPAQPGKQGNQQTRCPRIKPGRSKRTDSKRSPTEPKAARCIGPKVTTGGRQAPAIPAASIPCPSTRQKTGAPRRASNTAPKSGMNSTPMPATPSSR